MIAPEEEYAEIRAGVRALCAGFPPSYFRALDARADYPAAFVDGAHARRLARRADPVGVRRLRPRQ